MPKTIMIADRISLESIQNNDTNSVSHKFVIQEVEKELGLRGLIFKSEFRRNINGDIAQGLYKIINPGNSMGMLFTWINYHGKVTSFKCGSGAFNGLNDASIIQTDFSKFRRRRIENPEVYVRDHINNELNHIQSSFQQIVEDKLEMDESIITDENLYGILGNLYFKDIITSSQLVSIKSELKKPSYIYSGEENSLWVNYNHIINSIKNSHPKIWLETHSKIHSFLKEYCKSINTVESEISDPNQLDLIDEIQKQDENFNGSGVGFPEAPSDIPTFKVDDDSFVLPCPAHEVTESESSIVQPPIPLEEQIAGSTVEPVTQEELEISEKPIVNIEDETKEVESLNFNFAGADEIKNNSDSPFLF